MTSKERLTRIFKNQPVDRPAFKMWGLYPGMKLLSPKYKKVYELGMELTDVLAGSHWIEDMIFGQNPAFDEQINEIDGNLFDITRTIQAGDRKLSTVIRDSHRGEPVYILEHFVKEPEDLQAILQLPYTPPPVRVKSYLERAALVGDRGLVHYNIDSTVYMVQRLMGPELFSYMLYDEPELILQAAQTFQSRIVAEVKGVLDTGLAPVFGYVGPEICIPPHTSMDTFESLVFNMDKPICDLAHNAGGHVWMHCHGKVGQVIDRFYDMGIDVLNPIEPPPLGDCTLAQAIALGKGIGVEGNIEIMSILEDDAQTVKNSIDAALADTRGYDRFILGQSAGFEEYVDPTDKYIDNLITYLTYGYEQVNKK